MISLYPKLSINIYDDFNPFNLKIYNQRNGNL